MMKNLHFLTTLQSKKLIFILTALLLLLMPAVEAQIVKEMKPRTSPEAQNRSIYNVRGDFVMMGNTNLTLVNYGNTTDNNNIAMQYVNAENPVNFPGLVNSSSSTLRFSSEGTAPTYPANPACSEVVYAGLYWTGRMYGPSPNNDNPNTMNVTFNALDGLPRVVDSTYNQYNGATIAGADYPMTVTVNTGTGTTALAQHMRYSLGTTSTGLAFQWGRSNTNAGSGGDGTLAVSTTGSAGTYTNLTATQYSQTTNTTTNLVTRTFNTPYTTIYGGLRITVLSITKDIRGAQTDISVPYLTIRVESLYSIPQFTQLSGTITGGGAVTVTPYSMTVTVNTGTTTTALAQHTRYTFGTSTTTSGVVFQWGRTGTGAGSGGIGGTGDGEIQYSTTGTNGPWTTIPKGETNASTSGNLVIRMFQNPVVFTYQGMKVTVNGLAKDSRGNQSPTNTPYALLKIDGPGAIQVYKTITKTLRKDEVKLRHKDDTEYRVVTANSQNFHLTNGDITYPTLNTNGGIYVAYSDITAYVKAHGAGEYWVADLCTRQGLGDNQGYSGGWGMVVVYENDLMKWRDITVFDGYGYITSSQYTLDVKGFRSVQEGDVGVKMGVMATEGDVSLTGDQFGIRQLGGQNYTNLSHPGNVVNNFFNSSIYCLVDGTPLKRNPNLQNNTGIDIAMFDVPNSTKQHITNNQSETSFRYNTSQDAYGLFCFVVSIDAYIPYPEAQNIIYSLWDKDNNPLEQDTTWVGGIEGGEIQEILYIAYPGTKIRYALEIRNRGSEPINNMAIQVPVPYTTEFDTAYVITYPGYSFTTSQPTFDPFAGSMGAINWNVGTLPLPSTADHLFATLIFELTVSDDCEMLLAGGGCDPSVVIDGLVSGVGANTGVHFSDMRFIYGFKKGECQEIPLYLPPTIWIQGGDECKDVSEYEDLVINACLQPGQTSIPYDAVALHFPRGSRFFNQIETNTGKPPAGATEYSQSTGFPATSGVNFYAVPSDLNATCYWTFSFSVLPLPTFSTKTSEEMCGNENVDLSSLVLNVSSGATVYYYSDGAATNMINPVVAPMTTQTYYSRALIEGAYGCYTPIIPINVIVKPTITDDDIIINANDLLLCSGDPIIFKASTNLPITNPLFKWYESQTAEEPLGTGSPYYYGTLEVTLPQTVTLYVSISDPEDDEYCENPKGYRKEVTIVILNYPELTINVPRNYLCGGYTYFDLIPELDEGFDYTITVPYQWEWFDPVSEQFVSGQGGSDLRIGTIEPIWGGNATVPEMPVKYTPSAFDLDQDSIIIRMTITAYCGLVVDTVVLYAESKDAMATIEVVKDIEPMEQTCVEQEYIVKITEAGEGGLIDMNFIFEDWKASVIEMRKAEYLYEIPSNQTIDYLNEFGDWQPLNMEKQGDETYIFSFIPPTNIKLEEGDSILVRFTVYADCDFYAGSDYLISVTGWDACHTSKMEPQTTTTDKTHFVWTTPLAEYSIFSEFDKTIIENVGMSDLEASRTVKWSVKYVLDGGLPDITSEAIYFNIPTGMTIKSIMSTGSAYNYLNYPDEQAIDDANLETGYDEDLENREYEIPIYTGMTGLSKLDTVSFDITFYVEEGVPCDQFFFYIEIIHEGDIVCAEDLEPCKVHETEAGSYLDLEVQLYSFTPLFESSQIYKGEMNYNAEEGYYEWSGLHRGISESALFEGDIITVTAYADINGNGKVDLGIDTKMIDFQYPTFDREVGDELIFYVGQEIPWAPGTTIPPIPALETYSLLFEFSGAHICEDIVAPITTIFGPQVVCQGETIDYHVPAGMQGYWYEYISKTGGAAPERLDMFTLPNNTLRLKFDNLGEYQLSVRYAVPGTGNPLLNITTIDVTVAQNPELTLTNGSDTTICIGSQVELTHFYKETTEMENVVISYYKVEDNDDLTQIEPDGDGLILLMLQDTTHYVAIATDEETGCDSKTLLPFRVNVNRMPQVGTAVSAHPNCGDENGSIVVTVTGGSGNYLYSLSGEEGTFSALPANNTIQDLETGNYTIYILDALRPGCNASASQLISVAPMKKLLTNLTVNKDASSCNETDGEITITVSGGVEPYYYSVNDDNDYNLVPSDGKITGLKAGTYIIMVKDAGTCMATASLRAVVEAEGNDNLSMTLTQIAAADCKGLGTVKIEVSNGETPYKYSLNGEGWIDMLGDEAEYYLQAGFHKFYVEDAAGCKISDTITIENTSGLNAELISSTDALCLAATGSITMSVYGDAPFTYSTDGGVTNTPIPDEGLFTIPDLITGSYQVLITDINGCTFIYNDNIIIDVTPEFLQAVDNTVHTYINIPVDIYVMYNDYDLWRKGITIVPGNYEPEHGWIEIPLYTEGHFIYTPDIDFVGKDSVKYYITNECGLTDSAWLFIYVYEKYDPTKNYPPIALDDEYSVRIGNTINFEVRFNDYDIQGSELSKPEVLTSVSHGTLIQNPDGTFSYTPNADFFGVDVFTYRVCNEFDLCATAQVRITVETKEKTDLYIIATDDHYSVAQYGTLVINDPTKGILDNDQWPDECETLTFQIVDGVNHGDLTLNSNGTFTYTPTMGYAGADLFTYRLCCPGTTTHCDLANVFIFVAEGPCPDSAKIVKTTAELCEGESVDLETLILSSSENVDAVYYYHDRYYSNEMESTIVDVDGWYYIRAVNAHGCDSYDSLRVIVYPHATELQISANNVTGCSEKDAIITASTSGVTGTVTYYLYETDDAALGDYLATNLTGEFTISMPEVTSITDTVFYIAVEGDNYCENLAGARKAVTVRLYPVPNVQISTVNPHLCGRTNFVLNTIMDVYNNYTDVTYVWEWLNPATGDYERNNMGILGYPNTPPANGVTLTATSPTAYTYTPALAHIDAAREIHLRLTVNTPWCGEASANITLYMDVYEPDAKIEIVSYPETAISPCDPVEYILKVTETGEGGLTNIIVTMHDLYGAMISVLETSYLYPIYDEFGDLSNDWKPIDFTNLNLGFFVGAIPEADEILLHDEDTLWVKFVVSAECGFFGGNEFLFLLDGKDACKSNNLQTKEVLSEPLMLEFGYPLPEFYMESWLSPEIINNEYDSNDEVVRRVTWTVHVVNNNLNDLWDNEKVSLYFNMPTGMDIVSLKSVDNGKTNFDFDAATLNEIYETHYNDPATKEYAFPTPDAIKGLTDQDTIKFEITFDVNVDAACGIFEFYVEIIHEEEMLCGSTNCAFGGVLAGSYPTLEVDLYDIKPYIDEATDDTHAYMFEGTTFDTWGGYYRAKAYTPVEAGRPVLVSFYADMNNNGAYDVDIDEFMIDFEYPTGNHDAGDILPIYVQGQTFNIANRDWVIPYVPTKDGYGLLAHLGGDYLCKGFYTAIATLFGEREICEGDTVIFYTAEDMEFYEFFIGQGAEIPENTIYNMRIPLEGGTVNDYDTDNQMRVVFNTPGDYWLSIRYMTPIEGGGDMAGEWTGTTYMQVTARPRLTLTYTDEEEIDICRGTRVDINTYIEDDNTFADAVILFYELKNEDGTFTSIGSVGKTESFIVEPWDTTTYRISAALASGSCESKNALEFTINVQQPPRIGTTIITHEPECSEVPATGEIKLNVFGGNGNYTYGINDDDENNFIPLPVEDGIAVISGLSTGVHIIYIKNDMPLGVSNQCATTISKPITIRANNSGISAVLKADAATTCDATDATLTISVIGGIPPYMYSLDQTDYELIPVTGIIPEGFGVGYHKIYVKDDEGCTLEAGVTVWAETGLELTLTQLSPATCNTLGEAKIVVSGGTEPYAYKLTGYGWVDMEGTVDSTRVEAGPRTITVTDAQGCETSGTITIANTVSNLAITSIDVKPTTCWRIDNGYLTFSATGTEPLYYSFADIEKEIEIEEQPVELYDMNAGTYQLSLYDANGCKVMEENIIIERAKDFVQAVDNEVTTYVNQDVSGNVVTNDFDYNNGTLTVLGNGALQHGTFIGDYIAPDGYFTYQPETDFVGDEIVYYYIENECGLTSMAILTIHVLPAIPPPNPIPPVAVNDNYYTDINVPITQNVTLNDQNPSGLPLIVTFISTPGSGTLTSTNPNGTFTYTPNLDFVGVDQFQYQLCTTDGLCDIATVTIRVDDPTKHELLIIAMDNEYSVAAGETLTLTSESIFDNDVIPTDIDNFEMTLLADVENGTLTLNPDGTFIYIPEDGFIGTDGFEYQICATREDLTECDIAYVSIIVYNAPPPPTVLPPMAIEDEYATPINEVLNGNVITNDVNPNNDGSTISVTDYTQPMFGTVTVNSDGTFTYTPTPDYVGIDMFEYTICLDDPADYCDNTTVIIHIVNNDGLTIVATDDYYAVPQYGELEIELPNTILINDLYPIDLDEDLVINLIPDQGVHFGTLIFNDEDGTFIYIPTGDFVGTDGFGYEICGTKDDETVCDQAYVFITVYGAPCPDLPVFAFYDAQLCLGESVELLSLLQTGALHVDTIIFYLDNNFTEEYTEEYANVGGIYYARAFNDKGCHTDSYVYITVDPTTVGGTISEDQTICSGSIPAPLTLDDLVGTVVRWESSTDNFATAGAEIANTTTTLTLGSLTTSTYYRAVVQSGVCATAYSDTVLITVDPTSVGGTITENQTICYGSTPAPLTLGDLVGTIVRWESSTDNFATAGTEIANTTTTLTLGSHTTSTYYRAVVQSGNVCSIVYSDTVLITVDPTSVGGTISEDQTICYGSTPNPLTLDDLVGTVVRWESSTDNFATAGTNIANTTTTLTLGSLATSTYYRAVVQSGNVCATAYSDTVLITVDPTSVGGTITENQTICYGSTPNPLTLDDLVGTVVRWESSTDNFATAGTNIANTTTTLTLGSLTTSTYYRAVVQSGNVCATAYSDTVLITVDPTSVGGTITENQTICYGSTPNPLTLDDLVGTVVRWESSTDNFATAGTNIANTTTTLTLGSLATSTYYRAVVQSGNVCATAYSDTVLITVDPTSVGGTIAQDQTICYGSTPNPLTLSGKTGNVVRWESSTDNFATAGTNIANTTTSLTLGIHTTSTYYRAVVQSGNVCATAYSDTVLITVDPTSVGGTIAEDQTICYGSTPNPLILSGKTGNVVRWESSTNNFATAGTNIANTTTTLTLGSLTTSTYYRAVVQSGVCATAYSDTVLITVDPTSVGGTIAQDQTICSGSTPTPLTLSGKIGNVVRWESSTDNFATAGANIANTTTTLTLGSHTTSTYYRAVVQSGVCSIAYSDTVLITVDPTSVGGTIHEEQTICYGYKPEDFELLGKTGNVVKWQYSNDNFVTDFHDISVTSTTLESDDMGPTLTQDRYYRVEVKSGVCPSTYSDTVKITVNPLSVGGTTQFEQSICAGETPVDLNIIDNVGDVIYWEYSDDNFDLDFHTINVDELVLPGTEMGPLIADRSYRAAVQSGVCMPDYSTHLLITVYQPTVGGTLSADQSICSDVMPAALTLTGNTGDVVKWQYSNNNFASDVHDIANTSTTLTSLQMGSLTANRYYRVVVQNGVCQEETSNTVLISILPASVGGIIAPSDTEICEGTSTQLTLSGYVGNIEWQSSTISATTGFKTIPGQTSAKLNTGNLTETTWYRAVVTSNSCKSAVSNVVRVGFIPIPAITLISIQGTDAQTVRQPHEIFNIVYKLSPDVVITVTGLPDGLTWNVVDNILTISGAPLEIGTFNYTITVSNACGSGITAMGYIIVKEPCPATLTDEVNEITYNVVDLVGFCWYKENMYGAKYQDETDMTFAKPYYSSLYPNTAQNAITFGLLYTYEDLTGGELCPEGWRIPTAEEWALLNIYNMNDLRNPLYWLQPNNCTNLTGFDARGAGFFNPALQRFEDLYGYTAWWSSNSSATNTMVGIGAMMNYYCNYIEIIDVLKEKAISIRCLHE